jgi:glycosyltransferase involved in cell wall biosynthesis
MRLAFVVQRYGDEVAGGAEALCRDTARALAARGHEITVLSTTSRDYVPWTDYYPPGTSADQGVSVERFPMERADPQSAARLAAGSTLGWGDWEMQAGWVTAQGPVSRPLLGRLAALVDQVDAVALWTYLYATTQLGMAVAGSRAVLVPAAHDEPMLRFPVTRALCRLAGGFAYLTPEERGLLRRTHDTSRRPEAVVGTGVAPRPPGDATRARNRFALPSRFALYLGRLDPGKGIHELIDHHQRYRAGGGELGLVLAGRRPDGVRIPDAVTQVGFVSDAERSDLLAAADLLVMPSVNESLSLVLLEAWQQGTPTLVTARNPVLVGQSARSAGGLAYADGAEYAALLRRFASDAALRSRLGASGAAWVSELTWDRAAERWEDLLTEVAAGDR